jgi:hypothetical protein
MDGFWSGVGASAVGAVVALAVPWLTSMLGRRARRLQTLHALRSELATNALAIGAETRSVTAAKPMVQIFDAVGADVALWYPDTRDKTLIAYHFLRELSAAMDDLDAARVATLAVPVTSLPTWGFGGVAARDPVHRRGSRIEDLTREARVLTREAITAIDGEIVRVQQWDA